MLLMVAVLVEVGIQPEYENYCELLRTCHENSELSLLRRPSAKGVATHFT